MSSSWGGCGVENSPPHFGARIYSGVEGLCAEGTTPVCRPAAHVRIPKTFHLGPVPLAFGGPGGGLFLLSHLHSPHPP